MLTRIVVGLLLLPLLLIPFFAPDWAMAAAVSVISAVSVWELLHNTGFSPKKRLTAYAVVFAALVPLWLYLNMPYNLPVSYFWSYIADHSALPTIWDYIGGFRLWPYQSGQAVWFLVILIFVLILFAEGVADHEKVRFKNIAIIFTAAFIIPCCFSSLIYLGKYFILLPLIAALFNDICAYFTGVKFGKHKLTPVSPKKTVEGSIGGLVGVAVGMFVYGTILQTGFDLTVNFPLLLLYGLIGGVAGQLGDLSMSLIKREAGIKDFGKILPGHGGMLDRFDSVLFAAPVILGLMMLWPAIEPPLPSWL
ncbi:MAG: phosphatidate cytidylyltransferase [Oscillospiraceae bacterium]|nr:phosphatidate cytidylyltransferase [Oscillospiraceae bacterium]